MNERSILMVLIATMLCIPMFGMLPMIAPTTAQNSNIQITKVGRVDGNFLEMDFANYGKSDVWIQVDGILYRYAPTTLPTTLDIITHIMGFYFVNDVYHYEVRQWAPVAAGQTTQLFTQGDLQNVDNWLVYNVRVYEDGQFRLLYPDAKIAYIGTNYHDAREPAIIWGDARHSSDVNWSAPPKYGLIRGKSCSLAFKLLKYSDNAAPEVLCDRQLNFYIDNKPAPGESWYANSSTKDGACYAMFSGALRLSSKDTATLSPGMHMLTIEFLGDSTYGPANQKIIFRVM